MRTLHWAIKSSANISSYFLQKWGHENDLRAVLPSACHGLHYLHSRTNTSPSFKTKQKGTKAQWEMRGRGRGGWSCPLLGPVASAPALPPPAFPNTVFPCACAFSTVYSATRHATVHRSRFTFESYRYRFPMRVFRSFAAFLLGADCWPLEPGNITAGYWKGCIIRVQGSGDTCIMENKHRKGRKGKEEGKRTRKGKYWKVKINEDNIYFFYLWWLLVLNVCSGTRVWFFKEKKKVVQGKNRDR